MAPPRIVYAGPLNTFGSCLHRLQGLLEIEPQTVTFDTQEYHKGWSKLQQIDHALLSMNSAIRRLNRDFLALCEKTNPEIIWMDKGVWVWPSTLHALRRKGIFLVHHNNDALWPHFWLFWMQYRMLRGTLRLYDLRFTTNLDDYLTLQKSPDRRHELTNIGYNHRAFDTSVPLTGEEAATWANDLIFVGHHEARTERGILALVESGLKVTVYGPGWERAKHRARLGAAIKYKPLYLDDYVRALKAAKIGLSYFSEVNYCHTAMRSFETTACGTFLLALRSGQHMDCFKEGEEAEFFGSERELVEKAKFYLENDARRREIACKGHDRVVRSDYSWARYMRDDWAKTIVAYEAFRKGGSAT